MSAWSVRRRLAGAVIAGLALTLAPAVTTSASAAAEPPAAPSGVRVDLSTPPAAGSVKITWNASPSANVTAYEIQYTRENGVQTTGYSLPSSRTFTIPGINPSESLDVRVKAMNLDVRSAAAVLRVTGLDTRAPAYAFTDTAGNTFAYEIAWLSSSAITTGYVAPGGSRFFDPSAPVLREQIAAFLYRLAEPSFDAPYVAPAVSPFVDVPTSHRFYREITWLADQDITTGYAEPGGKVSFRPSQPVLREQFAAFLFRFDEASFNADYESFTDVPQSATFHDEIEWLASEGITTGYDNGNGTRAFRGGQPVLREQTAAFLYRYQNGHFGDNEIVIG